MILIFVPGQPAFCRLQTLICLTSFVRGRLSRRHYASRKFLLLFSRPGRQGIMGEGTNDYGSHRRQKRNELSTSILPTQSQNDFFPSYCNATQHSKHGASCPGCARPSAYFLPGDVPSDVLIGQQFTFKVRFKNNGSMGFGPFIDLVLPAGGAMFNLEKALTARAMASHSPAPR